MMKSRRSVCLLSITCVLLLGLGSAALAQHPDEWSAALWQTEAPGASEAVLGVPSLVGLLFAGTSTNVNDPTGAANDVFSVDPVANTASSILTAVGVWGATADVANQRVLFTRASGLTPPPGQIGGGDELLAIPFAGGAATSLGRIVDGAGQGFRIDGLAMSGGVLYGVNAGAGVDNGFYSIDLNTLQVTQIALFADSIGGLDADPDTGIIYGTNDTTGQLVTLSTLGVITNVIAYPGGLVDIDGLAVGNGMAYLVTDEAGNFPVYDIAGGTFGTPLTSPFTVADTFSGAALAVADSSAIFGDGFEAGDTSAWSSAVP